jgi:hypothetical protein
MCTLDKKPACSDEVSRDCDEALNSGGAGKCKSFKHCTTGRYCSKAGLLILIYF